MGKHWKSFTSGGAGLLMFAASFSHPSHTELVALWTVGGLAVVLGFVLFFVFEGDEKSTEPSSVSQVSSGSQSPNVTITGSSIGAIGVGATSPQHEQNERRRLLYAVGDSLTETRNVRKQIKGYLAKGHYWDPYHSDGSETPQTDAILSDLSTHALTAPAWEACDHFTRGVRDLRTLVTDRRAFEDDGSMDPQWMLLEPEVKYGELDDLLQLADRAEQELITAGKALREAQSRTSS